MDISQFTSAELVDKVRELADIIAAHERHAPESKAAVEKAALAAELSTMLDDPAGSARAERELLAARDELQQSEQAIDEARAALAGVRRILADRQASETQGLRDAHVRQALAWLEGPRAATISDIEGLLAQLDGLVDTLEVNDRAADQHLMRGGQRAFSALLQPQKLGRSLKALLLTLAPRLAQIADLGGGDRTTARSIAAGGYLQLRNPVNLEALRATLSGNVASRDELAKLETTQTESGAVAAVQADREEAAA